MQKSCMAFELNTTPSTQLGLGCIEVQFGKKTSGAILELEGTLSIEVIIAMFGLKYNTNIIREISCVLMKCKRYGTNTQRPLERGNVPLIGCLWYSYKAQITSEFFLGKGSVGVQNNKQHKR